MKKMLTFFVAVLCVLSMATIAAASVADVEGSGTIGATGSTLSIVTSSNVRISYVGSDQAYGAMGQHKAGNRAYATGSATPGIWYQEKTAGQFLGSSTLASTFDGSGWTAQ